MSGAPTKPVNELMRALWVVIHADRDNARRDMMPEVSRFRRLALRLLREARQSGRTQKKKGGRK